MNGSQARTQTNTVPLFCAFESIGLHCVPTTKDNRADGFHPRSYLIYIYIYSSILSRTESQWKSFETRRLRTSTRLNNVFQSTRPARKPADKKPSRGFCRLRKRHALYARKIARKIDFRQKKYPTKVNNYDCSTFGKITLGYGLRAANETEISTFTPRAIAEGVKCRWKMIAHG